MTSLHATTNYIVMVLGDGTNSLIRKVSPAQLLGILSGIGGLTNNSTVGFTAEAGSGFASIDGTDYITLTASSEALDSSFDNFRLTWRGNVIAYLSTNTTIFSSNVTASKMTLTVDDAYAAGWNSSLGVPTKNAIYDKIDSLSGGSPGGATTQIQFNNAGSLGGSPSNTGDNVNGVLRLMSFGSTPNIHLFNNVSGNTAGLFPSLWFATNSSIVLTAITNQWTFSGSSPLLLPPALADIGSTGSPLEKLFADQITTTSSICFNAATLAGAGGALTNFTGKSSDGTVYLNAGLTNVNFKAIMGGDSAIQEYQNYVLTNRTATSRTLSFDATTNNWICLQEYAGLAGPVTITNGTAAWLSTSTLGSNVYYAVQHMRNPPN